MTQKAVVFWGGRVMTQKAVVFSGRVAGTGAAAQRGGRADQRAGPAGHTGVGSLQQEHPENGQRESAQEYALVMCRVSKTVCVVCKCVCVVCVCE